MAESSKEVLISKSTPMMKVGLDLAMWFIIVSQQGMTIYMIVTGERLPPADWSVVFLTSAVWLGTAAETDVPAIVRQSPILKRQLRLLYGSQYFLAMLFLAALQGLVVPYFLSASIAIGFGLLSTVVLLRHWLAYIRASSTLAGEK